MPQGLRVRVSPPAHMFSSTALLITISSLLALASYVVYIIAILKGKAKPHRTTRFVLVLITALATTALFAEKSTVAIWIPGVFTLGSLAVFILSIKYGMGGWSKTDILCLFFALVGIVFWRATDNPLYGLYASIGADFIGQIPMLIKTYRYPETEAWPFYFMDVVAVFLNLLALEQWNIGEYAYPLYAGVIDFAIVLLIMRPRILLYAFKK